MSKADQHHSTSTQTDGIKDLSKDSTKDKNSISLEIDAKKVGTITSFTPILKDPKKVAPLSANSYSFPGLKSIKMSANIKILLTPDLRKKQAGSLKRISSRVSLRREFEECQDEVTERIGYFQMSEKTLKPIEPIDDMVMTIIADLKELDCVTEVMESGWEVGYRIQGTPLTLMVAHDDIKPTFLFVRTEISEDLFNSFWVDDMNTKDPNKLSLYVPVRKLFDLVDLPEEMIEFLAVRISMFVDGDISEQQDF